MKNNAKIKNVIESLKNDLEEGLLFCDVWSNDTGLSVDSFNPNPKYTALFWKITKDLHKALNGLGFPDVGKFQIIDLEADTMMLLIYLDEQYTLGSLIDKNEVSLGIVLNIAIPNVFESYNQ